MCGSSQLGTLLSGLLLDVSLVITIFCVFLIVSSIFLKREENEEKGRNILSEMFILYFALLFFSCNNKITIMVVFCFDNIKFIFKN